MDAFRDAAMVVLRQQEESYRAVIAGLPDAALNWRPGPETNSLAVLVAHAWGAAQAWISRAGGTEIARDRDAEFRVEMNAQQLAALLDAAIARVAEYIAAIDPATYDDLRRPPSANRAPESQRVPEEEFSVAWCIMHAVEHNQEHLGQAFLTRQLWEQGAIAGSR